MLATLGCLQAACGVERGVLLYRVDGAVGPDAGAPPLPATTSSPLIARDAAWQYQLQDEVDVELDAELFVVDLFNMPEASIATLHARGRLVLAYLSAGTHEPFRDDASDFPDAVIGNPLASYPNESWLDVRQPAVRDIMATRLDLARDKGFDGVLPTSMTAYKSDNGFDLSVADQDDYARWLSEQTRARGMRVGMSGDFERSAELGELFDWANASRCIARADCEQLLPFMAAGKTVLDIEMEGDATTVCAAAEAYGVNAMLKRPDLGAYRVSCP